MAKYRVKRFSDKSSDEKKPKKTLVGSGIRSIGTGVKKVGKIAGKAVELPLKAAGYGLKKGAREVYAGTGVKPMAKAIKYTGEGLKGTGKLLDNAVEGTTGILGDKVDSVGDYTDKLATDPKKTLKDTGEYIIKNPDKALVGAAGTALMLSTPIAATAFAAGAPTLGAVAMTPGLTEAGVFLPKGYEKLRDKVSQKFSKKKVNRKSNKDKNK